MTLQIHHDTLFIWLKSELNVCAYKSPVCCVYTVWRAEETRKSCIENTKSRGRRCARCEFDISLSACTIFLKLPRRLWIYLRSWKLPQHLFLFLPHSVRACGWVDEKKRRVRFFMRAILNDAPLSGETSEKPQISRAANTSFSLARSSVCERENKCSSANVEIKLIARGVALFCAFFSRALCNEKQSKKLRERDAFASLRI